MPCYPLRLSYQLVIHLFISVVLHGKSIIAQFVLPELQSSDTQMPKGVFHYNKQETGITNQFVIPNADFSQPMEMATELINTAMAESSHKQQALSGINIPMPFGMTPLNIQLGQDSETKLGVKHNESEATTTVSPAGTSLRRAPELDVKSRVAMERARRVCLEESQQSCDAALDRYHRIRFGTSPAERQDTLRKSQPTELSKYVQTGLAKWLVPGLNKGLDQMVLDDGTADPAGQESAEQQAPTRRTMLSTTTSTAPTGAQAERRRHPTRAGRKQRRRLITLPPRSSPMARVHPLLPPRN